MTCGSGNDISCKLHTNTDFITASVLICFYFSLWSNGTKIAVLTDTQN